MKPSGPSLFLITAPGALFAAALALLSLALASSSRGNLGEILLDSRIVLCNEGSRCSGKIFRGAEQKLIVPGPPPEGTFLLADTHLSQPGDRPAQVLAFRSIENCQGRARIKKARLEVLYRRANDPDREFLIPRALVVWQNTLSFPDHCGWHSVNLDLPAVAPDESFKETQLLIVKITVLDVYGTGPVSLGGLLLN